MKKYNRIISVFLIVLSLFYLYMSYQLPAFPYVNVDSDFVPKVLGYLLLFLSILLLFSRADADEEARKIPKKELRVLFTVLAMILFYVLFLEILGFIVTNSLFLIFLSRYLGYMKWKVNILVGVAYSFIIYFSFNYLLKMNLPGGILPF